MGFLRSIKKYGLGTVLKVVWNRFVFHPYHLFRCRNAEVFHNPDSVELNTIEKQLIENGVQVVPDTISETELMEFKELYKFPSGYHGGVQGGVWDEKILEHFIAFKYCGLSSFKKDDIYVDVAGCTSPWSKLLREKGIQAYSIDLNIPKELSGVSFYLQTDAKNTEFKSSSISACSLQCAFEMFMDDDDFLFIDECQRILKPGGKVVISPLYMHTQHCGYATPEYFKKGYSDNGAKEYVRKDCWGVPFSRKYSAVLLKNRILDRIHSLGMDYTLFKITNKESIGSGIYCHFFLIIAKNIG